MMLFNIVVARCNGKYKFRSSDIIDFKDKESLIEVFVHGQIMLKGPSQKNPWSLTISYNKSKIELLSIPFQMKYNLVDFDLRDNHWTIEVISIKEVDDKPVKCEVLMCI